MSNPWIPDLIVVESQGIANAISSNVGMAAGLLTQSLMLLNAAEYELFKAVYIY
jgi:hypothetical protein